MAIVVCIERECSTHKIPLNWTPARSYFVKWILQDVSHGSVRGWKGPTKGLWFEFIPVDPLELLDSNHACHASCFVIQQNRPVKATACEMGWDPRCTQYEQWHFDHFDQRCLTPLCQQAQSPYRRKRKCEVKFAQLQRWNPFRWESAASD